MQDTTEQPAQNPSDTRVMVCKHCNQRVRIGQRLIFLYYPRLPYHYECYQAYLNEILTRSKRK